MIKLILLLNIYVQMETLYYAIENYNQTKIDISNPESYHINNMTKSAQSQFDYSTSNRSNFNIKNNRKYSPKIFQKNVQMSPKSIATFKKNKVFVPSNNKWMQDQITKQSAPTKSVGLVTLRSEIENLEARQKKIEQIYTKSFYQLHLEIAKQSDEQIIQNQTIKTIKNDIQSAKKDVAQLIKLLQTRSTGKEESLFYKKNKLFEQKQEKNQSFRIKEVTNLTLSPRNKLLITR